MSGWSIRDIPSQQGKLAVVTGANSGLGYETALALAQAGAEVIVAARSADKGNAAVEKIRAQVPSANLRFESLDLASLASVAAFSTKLLNEARPLDLLINNAGVMALAKRKVTTDGFEMQLGTNYLGHYALTAQLLPLLRRASAPRVVNLSSLMHRVGKIHLDDLQLEHGYTPYKAYGQSKLAMLMFALELQRRSDANGWGLTSSAAHPGGARTQLMANGPGNNILATLVMPLITHSAAAGALPTLYAATSLQAKPSGYYGPNGILELKGDTEPARISAPASDAAVAGQLWDESQRLTGLTFG